MPMFGGLEPRRGLASDSDLNRDAAKGSPCLTSRAVEFFHCGNLSKSSQLVLGALESRFYGELSVSSPFCAGKPRILYQSAFVPRATLPNNMGSRVSLETIPKCAHTMDRQSWCDKKYEDEVRSVVAWCSISVKRIVLAPGIAGRSL